MYDWNDIRIFNAVARTGSALSAAHALGMNQSTVTRRIDALEHALGIRLFLRDTRGSTLTHQGSMLLEHAAALEERAHVIDKAADLLRRDLRGVIRVTAPEALMVQFVGPVTLRFRHLHPEVRFDYVSAEHRLNMESGEADVAFRAGGMLTGDKLVCQSLPSIAWSVYCLKSYQDGNGSPTGFADLAEHALIGYGGGLERLPGILFFMSQCPQVKVVATSNSVPNMSSLIKAGIGVGLLPCLVGDLQPDFVRCFDPGPETDSPWWIITSEEAHQLARVRLFVAFAAEEIRRDRSLLEGRATRNSA